MVGKKVKINTEKFLSPDYLKMVARVVNNIIEEDNQLKSLDLIKLFSEALSQEDVKLKISREIANFYSGLLVKLKFIALPLLEDKEIINLLSHSFVGQFQIEDYKLLDKFNYKLLGVILVADRDNLKRELLNYLLKSQEIIVNNGQIKSVCDWLKKYVSEVGIESNDGLVKAHYFQSSFDNHQLYFVIFLYPLCYTRYANFAERRLAYHHF